jgi:pentatricopeptide repeat protein
MSEKTTKKNALIRFWESMEKTADSIKIARSARSLQRQAEIDVAKSQDELEAARSKFEEAKVKAKDDSEKGFKNIYEAFMNLKVKQKRFEDAVTVYKEMFEEEPKLLG